MLRLILFRQSIVSLALAVLLTACRIEGGVPTPLPQPTGGTAATQPAPPLPTPIPVPTQVPRAGWTIGMLQREPNDLLPYYSDAADRRATAPVADLIFSPPVLSVGYNYTTTGVIEQVPTVENGGVELRTVDVFLDESNQITTTQTESISQVQQLAVTFRWNPALRWSDGTPLTAQDSVFAYEFARDNLQDDETRTRVEALVSYEAIDDHTTRAVLQPDLIDPTYPMLAWTPLPRHLLAGKPLDALLDPAFARNPVGYGPYTIENWLTGTLTLTPNTFHPAATGLQPVRIVYLPTIELLRNEVLNGSMDVAMSDFFDLEQIAYLEQDKQTGAAAIEFVPAATWEHIDFNLDVKLLQDIRMRRAIAYGVNRQQIVNELLASQGRVLDSWLLPEQWAAAPPDQITRYDYNPDEARRLLDEAGFVDTDGDGLRNLGDGSPLTLRLLTSEGRGSTLRAQIAESVKRDLAQVGIGIDIQQIEQQQFFSPEGPLFRREFDLALFAWMATPDPGGRSLWTCNAVPSERNGWRGENFSGWCFRDADLAIRVASTSLDRTERVASYLKQQQLFTQELPSLPLLQRVITVIAAPNLRGPAPDQHAPITWNLLRWMREP